MHTSEKKPRSALQRLLKPQHIAFIGGNNLADAIRSTESIGFSGDIWVVNPQYEAIAGRRCFRRISDLPAPPDAAFIAVNKNLTIAAVRELAALGAGGAVCYAAGFAETGTDGQQQQRELVEAAGDLALVGPNCYGILNYLDGVALWPDRHGGKPLQRGAALISQSGNIALNLTMTDRSCPLAYVISVGNQAKLGVQDYIAALLDDSRVSAIGIYLEGLTDIAAFSRVAIRALEQGVPIVVFKVGASKIGTQLTLSHTSSLAGSDELYDALFQRLGVIRVGSPTHLIETLKLCTYSGLPRGSRLTVLTCSGGDSAIAADFSEDAGLQLPPLEEAQMVALRQQLPDFASLSNPLDYNTAIWGKPDELERCYTTALDSSNVDATLLILDFPTPESGDRSAWYEAVAALIRASKATRAKHPDKITLVASVIPEAFPADARADLAAAGITPLQGIWRALKALADVAWYADYRRITRGNTDALLLLPLTLAESGTEKDELLDEWESKSALAKYGIPVPDARTGSIDTIATLSESLAYPVVLKIVSREVPHKTEAGAVQLNLNSRSEVASAALSIQQNLLQHGLAIPADSLRFLVEKMAVGVVAELIIGVKRDPQFGLVLILGSGGIFVEILKDSAVLLLPTNPEAVRKALQNLRSYPLLQGFRGRAHGDVDAVIDAVMSVAAFVQAQGERLLEVDINPLLVLPQGHGVLAADALIRQIRKRG